MNRKNFSLRRSVSALAQGQLDARNYSSMQDYMILESSDFESEELFLFC